MPAKPASIVDPYATLGLEPTATPAEVKRAYRRLAKAFHPDSAGEQAVPRFLAIQAAYEQIRTGHVILGGNRGGRGPAPAPTAGAADGPGTEPWRADPARARAARERARTRGAGAKSGASGPRPAGTDGAASGSGGAGARSGGRTSTGTSGTGGTKRRSTRKATMGSTSYDEARDPADATWSGASWYGPSTGEYWIVNPREYADPRKHGPDYQQRARRPIQGGADEPSAPPSIEEPPIDERRTDEPVATASARATPRSRPEPRWAATATESGWARAGETRTPEADPEVAPAPPLRWLGEQADDPVRRLGLALVAWPPVGLATAALIGDATGCATFGAQCDGAEPMLPWLAQAVILGLLLLLPPLARVLTVGTIAVLVGLVPVTAFLLAVGASGAPQAAPVLAVLLGVLWLAGVGWAAVTRLRPGLGSARGRGAGT